MRRLLVLLTALLMFLATSACGGDSNKSESDAAGDEIKGLSVSGSFGDEPKVTVKPAVKVAKPETEVLSDGDGDAVRANKKALLNIVLVKGADGSQLFSSQQQGAPLEVTMAENQIFKVLIDGLVGKTRGSRVAIAATVKDAWGDAGAPQLKLKPTDTILFVVDVLAVEPQDVLDGPEGSDVDPPTTVPAVQESDGKVSGFDFSQAPERAPGGFRVIPLVKGDGPVVKDPSLATVDYVGQVYGSAKPFNNSYASQPATFGLGTGAQVISAWNKGLVGLARGSRVLLVVPPADGYGPKGNPAIKVGPKDTMVFLVDILGVG